MATRPPAISGDLPGGGGGHATTFGVACLLVWGFGLSPEEAMPLMLEYNARCQPPWAERDLWHKLRSAESALHKEPRGHLLAGREVERGALPALPEDKPRRKKAEFMLSKLQKVQDKELAMSMTQWSQWLRERSPVDPHGVTATQYLDALYEPREAVLVFANMRSRGDWGRFIQHSTWKLGKTPENKPVRVELPEGSPEGMTFLMQPVDGQWRLKANSTEMSRRTKASVTRWPYILLESDKAPHELWLNALVRANIRIVSITTSGGRSLHTVVRLDKATEEELQAEIQNPNAREVLTVLGCDPGAMQSLVYPRLPNTWREGKTAGKRDAHGQPVMDGRGRQVMGFMPFQHGRVMQRLLYFNPSPEPGRCIAEGLQFERGK